MAIRSTTTKLKMDEVVAALLSEEMQKESSKAAKEALSVRGRSKEKSKKKDTKVKVSRVILHSWKEVQGEVLEL